MYYICKFSDSWSLYDGNKQTSRTLEKPEIEIIKNMFPGLLNDSGKILDAIQVSSIQPNKLISLSAKGKNGVTKKNETPTKV
jgi:hypothetical protein